MLSPGVCSLDKTIGMKFSIFQTYLGPVLLSLCPGPSLANTTPTQDGLASPALEKFAAKLVRYGYKLYTVHTNLFVYILLFMVSNKLFVVNVFG